MAGCSPDSTEMAPDSNKCLLCVDDHPEVLGIMGEFLRVSGYSVLTAATGQRGLQLLRQHPVDAVILDYEMPKMDGAELASRIKQRWPDLPILMFTGYPAEVPHTVHRSVDALVVKGEPADNLLQKIQDLVCGNHAKIPRKTAIRVHNPPARSRKTGHSRRGARRSA